MANRKILKEGANVITINNQLVSVTEDYPFWRINQDTSEQYWNAFDAENTSVPYSVNITNNIKSFVGTSSRGYVTCDGVNHYSIPAADSSIIKFNSETEQLTYIGSLSGIWKFSGGVAVGKYIYYIPNDFTSILKLDTEFDTFVLIGSFAGSNKWGRPILLPDGRIFAPKYTANTHLFLDTSTDTVTLLNATNTTTIDYFEGGTWYYNGFVYGVRGLGGNSLRVLRINLSDNSETIVNAGGGTSLPGCIAVYKNLTFMFPNLGTTGIFIWDNTTNTYLVNIPTISNSNIYGTSVVYGSDGWIYAFSQTLLKQNIRLNPKNLSVEVLFENPNIAGNQNFNALCGKNGKIYIFNGSGLGLRLLNSDTPNQNINTNKLLHRNINKI